MRIDMLRQQRRRLERQWRKIKIGEICTDFIEKNSLFSLPHVISFQGVKVSEELACIHNIALFDFKKDRGHGEYLTTCLFFGGFFKSLDFMRLGFVQEFDLWDVDEFDE
jgi:hypothetical protein